jgi:hypothetical protein
MYSFASRSDCTVWDEPFYAPFLEATGLDHPMREEILAAHERNAGAVIQELLGTNAGENTHSYAKLMTHHMLPDFDRSWMHSAKSVFLIRHPARVIASYVQKREMPTFADLGFQQQIDLFEEVEAGNAPVVVDSADIRSDPEKTLKKLCEAIGIEWQPAMLHWPKGGHSSDGAWASHWYGSVHASSGFAGPEGPMPDLPEDYRPLLEKALEPYEYLQKKKI